MTVCHLGDLGHVLTQAQAEELDGVDVLLVPVGGTYTIDAAQAAEVVSMLEPKIVIPMHFQTEALTLGKTLDPVDKFLKEMGQPGVDGPAQAGGDQGLAARRDPGRRSGLQTVGRVSAQAGVREQETDSR